MIETNNIPSNDYAGKYLREYETSRYSLYVRAMSAWESIRSIIVPVDAEEFADVSFYQLKINWDVYALNARAVVLRIGQGIWIDTEFERNYAEAKVRNLLVFGYWFYDGRYSPSQQRDKLLEATAGKSFDGEIYADWERNYNGAHEGLPNVVAFMQAIEGRVVCKDVGMYTGYYYFLENSNPSAHASQYNYLKNKPLWLAWYAAASFVKYPAPWTNYTHWQYGTPVVDWGQATEELDMNKSRRTRLEFAAYYGGAVEPPPTGEPMDDWYRVNTGGLNTRKGPGAGYALTGLATLKMNDIIEVIAASSSWLQIKTIKRVSGAVETPALAWCHGGYCVKIDPPTVPPAGLPATLYISTVADHSDEKIYKVVV